MPLTHEELLEIVNRPRTQRFPDWVGVEEGPELTERDEEILDRCWAALGERLGVEQLPDQPTEEEIYEHYLRLRREDKTQNDAG